MRGGGGGGGGGGRGGGLAKEGNKNVSLRCSLIQL